RRTRQERDETQREPEHKTSQKKHFPGHAFSFKRAGWRTSNNRSVSPGFSNISCISLRHRRESGCFPRHKSDSQSSGSFRNRSAPPTSQRSSLSSSAPRLLTSSVEYPSGSSTRDRKSVA